MVDLVGHASSIACKHFHSLPLLSAIQNGILNKLGRNHSQEKEIKDFSNLMTNYMINLKVVSLICKHSRGPFHRTCHQ